MKNYLVIYYAPAQDQTAAPSAAQMEEAMKPWFAWKAKIESNIVDFGAPLGQAQEQNKAGEWSASGKQVSGYTILKAENYEAAQGMVQDHHHLQWAPGASLGLYETVAM